MAEYTKNEEEIDKNMSTLNTLLKESGDYFNIHNFIKYLEDKDKQIASLSKETETLIRQQQQQQQQKSTLNTLLKESGDYFNKHNFIKQLEDKDKQIASLNKEIETLKRQQKPQQQQEKLINELKEKYKEQDELLNELSEQHNELSEQYKKLTDKHQNLKNKIDNRKTNFNPPIGAGV